MVTVQRRRLALRWVCFGLLFLAAALRVAAGALEAPVVPAATEVEEQTQESTFAPLAYAPPEGLTPLGREDGDLVQLQTPAGVTVEVEALLEADKPLCLPDQGPAVLIVHTHGTEAYSPATYRETAPYHTGDETQNVLAVGKALCDRLNALGIPAIQHRALPEGESYYDAYAHMEQVIAGYLEQYPGICMVIDLHRDAAEDAQGRQVALEAEVAGQAGARLLFVVGTDLGGMEHPGWRENLTCAVQLQALCERENPGIFRSLSLRTGRYNGHLTPGSLLLEVGAAGNTLEEALVSVEFFALQLARWLAEP